MLLKLICITLALVNVKGVDSLVDNNELVLNVPSRNEGTRYYEIQRGLDGEMTGLVEVQKRPKFVPVLSQEQKQETVKPLLANTRTISIAIPEEKPQPAPSVLIEKNSDKNEDVVFVEIDNKAPLENPPKEDIFVINEQPQPKPEPRPVVITQLPEPAPKQIPQPVIIAPPPKPQPAPSQVVVIPAKQPEPTPDRVVVIPAKQPEPTPDRVVVIPAKQPEPTPDRFVVIPGVKPEPKPVVNYIVKTPVQPEPAPKPNVNVIYNQLFDYECRSANGYFSLQDQCNRFVECKEFKAYYYECPEGMNFNRYAAWPNYPCGNAREVRCESKITVIERSSLLTRECPSPYGLYALPDNECSNYIACEEGVATLMACPKGLVFNPTLEACDWLENMPTCRPMVFSGVTCPAFQEGDVDFIPKYRYGQSCAEYVACIRGVPRLLKCDAGLAFDEQLQHCVSAERVQSCSYKFV